MTTPTNPAFCSNCWAETVARRICGACGECLTCCQAHGTCAQAEPEEPEEPVNLDSMDDADLRAYVRDHGVSSPYGATDLSRYARLTLYARQLRRSGRIPAALEAEAQANAIYASLRR